MNLPRFAPLLALAPSLAAGCFVDRPDCPSGAFDADNQCVSLEPVGDIDTGLFDEDTGLEDPGDPPPIVTCAQVQQGEVSGTVTLEGVVATSDSADWSYGVFVQDIGGGPWSGLFVYLEGLSADVQRGDQLTLTGEISEYYDLTEITVGSPSEIAVTGTRHPVETALTAAEADWEPYEGVLVELVDLSVTSVADAYGEGQTSFGLPLDDMFFGWHEHVISGDRFAGVTGVVNYSYGAFKLEPRDLDDFRE